MLNWQDVIAYLRLFMRWWYVLTIAVVLASSTAWYILSKEPDIFVSQATLMVGNNFAVSMPSEGAVKLSNVLASYYAAMTQREVILDPVVQKLHLAFPWIIVRDRMLKVQADPGANLLVITITDTNPERAAALANAIADQLIAYTPNASEQARTQQAEVERQLQDAQTNIDNAEKKIKELNQKLSTLSSAIDISDIQSEIDSLQKARDKYADEYKSLLDLRNQSSVNTLTLFESAQPAPAPLPKKQLLTLGAAGLGGLLLAILAVLLLDRFDERWRTGSELRNRTGIKSLGVIPDDPAVAPGTSVQGTERERTIREAFSNMVLAAKSRLPRSLLISSPYPRPARSKLALDIAEMYVRTGHRVLIVDAESNQSHLTGLLTEKAGGVKHYHSHQLNGSDIRSKEAIADLFSFIKTTTIPNILLLSGRDAGYESFAAMVPAVYWPEMMVQLHEVADVVIFDGPAVLLGPDAAILAPLFDGILLELNGRYDSRATVIKAFTQLSSQSATHFLGAIITKTRDRQYLLPWQSTPKESGKKSGIKVSIGPTGVTITFDQKISNSESGHNGAVQGSGSRFLTAEQSFEDRALRSQVKEAYEEPATLEQLIELGHAKDRAKIAADARTQYNVHSAALQSSPMIVTPPSPIVTATTPTQDTD